MITKKQNNTKLFPVFITVIFFVISLTHASRHISPFLFLCPSLLFFLSLCLYVALFHETRYEFSYDWIFHYFDYKNVDEVLIVIYTKSIVLKCSSHTFFSHCMLDVIQSNYFKHIFKSFRNLILLNKNLPIYRKKSEKESIASTLKEECRTN